MENGNGSAPSANLQIPIWVVELVGRLVLDNEAMRHALAQVADLPTAPRNAPAPADAV